MSREEVAEVLKSCSLSHTYTEREGGREKGGRKNKTWVRKGRNQKSNERERKKTYHV